MTSTNGWVVSFDFIAESFVPGMLIYDGEVIPSFGDELTAASNFRDAQF